MPGGADCRTLLSRAPVSTLKTLYKTKADYQARVERRLAELERQGWSLPLYHNLILGDAAKVAF